jgi:hypothetical protein
LARCTDGYVSEGRQVGECFFEVSPSSKIPPRNPHHLATAPPPQLHEQLRFRNRRISVKSWGPRDHISDREPSLQIVVGD